MGRSEQTDDEKVAELVVAHEQHRWGASEELLLACAVNRHGTESWDSVAVEVKDRTPGLGGLTSQNCMDKFNDLKRRYHNSDNDDVTDGITHSLVDELRRVRVEELRREVQRRDVSIVSLELKVKRLTEERERSLKEEADLATEKNLTPATMIDAVGDELDDRSFNESNSTSQQQKPEATRPKEENDTATLEAVTKPEPEPDSVSPRSDPYWSHKDDDNNENEEMTMRPGQAGGVGDSNELGESVGESKREEKDKNSDVQSSASLTLKKKKRGRRTKSGGGVAVGSSSGEEPEVSPSTKRASAIKCEPLIKIIEIIRSHRLGSAFERRLRSQESERYKNLVRQHIDLQTVQHRLDKGVYSNAIHRFFRDLLLLFNNSIFFFRKNSPEHLAAVELRSLVLKQKAEKFPNLKPHKAVVRVETEPRTTQFSKPALVPCATRNNIRSQPENAVKKKEKKEKVVEETLKPKEKKIEATLVKVEENGSIKKKRTKERSRSGSSSGCRNLRASNKGNGEELQHRYGGNELSSHDNFDMKVDKKSGYRRKRQGAASFLKRMKQNSSELAEKESDSSSSSSPSSEEEEERKEEGKGKEDKKKRRKKETDVVRKAVTRSSRGRGTREVGKSKRIGRPPKRQAQETGKRGRDVVDSEVGGGGRGSGRGRKKPRR